MIENVLKSFTGEQIFVINKHFEQIKEKFLDTYGFDNKNLVTKDLVDVITSILESVLNPPTEFEIQTDTSTIPAGANLSLFILLQLLTLLELLRILILDLELILIHYLLKIPQIIITYF